MAGMSVERGDKIRPLYVRQGFLWEDQEAAVVRRFLASLKKAFPRSVLPLAEASSKVPPDYPSRWALDESDEVPGASTPDEAVFLPGRNLALLTQAAIHAQSNRGERIQIGVLSGNPFSDSTSEFFQAFETSVLRATGRAVRVERPIRCLTKTEVLEHGIRFDLRSTLSCIRPRDGVHCGACNKCSERRRAFQRAGLPDPARYAF